MDQLLLVVDLQASFDPPDWQVDGIARLAPLMRSAATVQRHDESLTPFWRELAWKPVPDDEPLVATDRVFPKYGYTPPAALLDYLRALAVDRVLVCGIQADACCLAAGFALFDAGLRPTLLRWLAVGSRVDPTAEITARLWRYHFGRNAVIDSAEEL